MATTSPRSLAAMIPFDFRADKTWRVWIVSGGERYGEVFLGDLPNVYTSPVGYVGFQIRLEGFELFTPVIPITQQEMIVPGPLGVSDGDLQIRGYFFPDVVGDIELVRNR